MQQFISGALAASLALVLMACVPGTSGPSTPTNAAKTVLMKINGRPITSDDLLTSPVLRPKLRQFIMMNVIQEQVAKAAIKLDEAEFNKEIEEQKRMITQDGQQSWEDFLHAQALTEKEFLDQMRQNKMMEKYMDTLVKVSDEEIKDLWDKQKDQLIMAYLNQNHLPESERSKVTFDKVKDIARDQVKGERGMQQQSLMFADLILNTKLELTAVNPSHVKAYEDVILNSAKKDAEKQKTEIMKNMDKDKGGEPEAGVKPGEPGKPGAAGQPPAGGDQKAGGSADQPSDGDKTGDAGKSSEQKGDAGKSGK